MPPIVPNYVAETVGKQTVQRLVALVEQGWPDWTGFDDPRYLKHERDYKIRAVDKARTLLSESELERLIQSQDFDEIIRRIVEVGSATNLLFRSAPRTGDLGLVHQDSLDREEFAHVFRDLLFGTAPSPQRLAGFVDWAEQRDLPNRWTLPTYFLFLLHPESELFVKPETTTRFMRALGFDVPFLGRPNPESYELLLAVGNHLRNALKKYSPRDMVDVQGLIWVVSQHLKKDPEALAEVELATSAELEISEIASTSGLPEDQIERWIRAIQRKKQAVLFGPPGTGKTFVASMLARHLIGGTDGFSQLLQFHPSYAYEDFIQGIRPVLNDDEQLTYQVVDGRFLEFCRKARDRTGPCVLILDEINRANLSRVFGELMYLLEYREQSIPLPSGESFRIPENVRLIGTMNTADRSIALVDHALRRRFAFLRLDPNFDALGHFHSSRGTGFDPAGLIEALERVNSAIDDPGYSLGISYFCREDLADQVEDIWRMEIEPYLEEYFFNDRDKVEALRWESLGDHILDQHRLSP